MVQILRKARPSWLLAKTHMDSTYKSVFLLLRPAVGDLTVVALLFSALLFSSTKVFSQGRTEAPAAASSAASIPKNVMLRIVRAEDERRWDNDLRSLLSDTNPNVRARAALAAGRIGDEDSVTDLIGLLRQDNDNNAKAMAAFALGETESSLGANPLLASLKDTSENRLRARTLEALGKIAAALPKEQAARGQELGEAILKALMFEKQHRSAADRLTVLLGLTATLRAKPKNAGPAVAQFLTDPDPRIKADAANTLARLGLKDGNDQLRKLLVSDIDPIVRANAARVLGATEDKPSFEQLLDRALNDNDSRVRVSAIRALASLKDPRAGDSVLERASYLTRHGRRGSAGEANEVLELATALGRIKQGMPGPELLAWLTAMRENFGHASPELEIALARISPGAYLSGLGSGALARTNAQKALMLNWREGSSMSQGLGEIAALPDSTKDKALLSAQAEEILRAMLDYRNSGLTINTLVAVHSEYAIPDVLRAYAAFKPKDLGEMLRKHLKESDVIVRATAAELLAELPDEANLRALTEALPVALRDEDLNDAALAILDSLAKYKSIAGNEAIKTALESQDYLIRRKAVTLLIANGAGDFSSRIGKVHSANTTADYERAISRIGKQVNAVVTTTKGAFTVELLPDEAPLNVDNFIQLSRRRYFEGITFHRVVPNFVIQGGDPRGDGNGGPGYQIRCEINEVPYERGTVGMALSGKDTGGSQWFVTHSPQPHLDGGYTVFGNVIAGMDVVDNIVRGDVIRSIVIRESTPRASNQRP